MKVLFYLFSFIFFCEHTSAQTTRGIPFQCIPITSAGSHIYTGPVSFRISIRDSIPSGGIVFQETHSDTTNAQGLVNLVIGQGVASIGSFSGIDWASNPKFLHIEMDTAGGTSYTAMGTQQMMSLPYALFADKVSAADEKNLIHHVGEYFEGGVIFHVYRDADGSERGLIAALQENCNDTTWDDNSWEGGIGSGAASRWDGKMNTVALGEFTGHATNAAKLCLDLVSGGYDDWYLPAIEELTFLNKSLYIVNRNLASLSGGTPIMSLGSYWSSTSTEDVEKALAINFFNGTCYTSYKNSENRVRAIRSFTTGLDAGNISGSSILCEGTTSLLTNTAVNGYWYSNNPTVAVVDSAGLVTGVSTGLATISYIISGNCGSAFSRKVLTVNPLPAAGTITGTSTVCAGSTTALSNANTGGTWSSTATGVATIGGTGIVSGVAAGTTTISYTVTNVCGTATTTQIITVNPVPSAGTITGTATVTAGSTTTLSNATGGGSWSSSSTSIATVDSTGIVTGLAVGTATISYTVTNGCAAATRVVTVSAAPGTVGATYGGGVIAYILQTGDPGYTAGETHGLIAAPSDQGTAAWGCYGTYLGTSTDLGTGAANTATVSAACGTGTAARLCADMVLNGYDDWYLPSLDELKKLYINRIAIGGFVAGFYWSSSENGADHARHVFFAMGDPATSIKYLALYVRAVRAF